MNYRFNMPDGCVYTSDLDYYDALNGRWDDPEADEDACPDFDLEEAQ